MSTPADAAPVVHLHHCIDDILGKPVLGCYYVDDDGESWATFEGGPRPCSICGTSITHGYWSSIPFSPDQRHICLSHAIAEYTHKPCVAFDKAKARRRAAMAAYVAEEKCRNAKQKGCRR